MKLVHVAVAVITDDRGRVLIQKRAADAHQGGLWEFPGGKVEDNESLEQALSREIAEELAIQVQASRPLITIEHDYGDRTVMLDVHVVTAWQGSVQANEGQPLIWVHPEKLSEFAMPAADKPIVNAIRLPLECLVTPPEITDHQLLINAVEKLDQSRRYLLLYRVKKLQGIGHEALLSLLTSYSCLSIMLHHQHQELSDLSNKMIAGMHVPQNRINEIADYRLNDSPGLLSAACHDLASLQQAQSVGADFVFLSPVKPTGSHPGAAVLGWEQFAALARSVNLPVYALGGVDVNDLETSWQHGGQGIAGIRYWCASE